MYYLKSNIKIQNIQLTIGQYQLKLSETFHKRRMQRSKACDQMDPLCLKIDVKGFVKDLGFNLELIHKY